MLIPIDMEVKGVRVYKCKGGFCIGYKGKVYKNLNELIQKSGD